MSSFEKFDHGIYLRRYPMSLLGIKFGRNVTILPKASGELIIHSTAPFSAEDISQIFEFGDPKWILDATNFHDTFADHAASAFPDLSYLTPNDFLEGPKHPFGEEIEVIPVAGMPTINEFAFLHRESGTLVLADLIFNLDESAGRWSHSMMRILAGIRSMPGNSRLFRSYIADDEAFDASVREILDRDFETRNSCCVKQ